MTRKRSGGEERLIGALVPRPIPRPPPPPALLPVLPVRQLPAVPDVVLLDVARLDRSGRLSTRGLLRALSWRPGHRVDIDVVDAAITIRSARTGRHAVGDRGELALPAPVRHLCAIGAEVVLAAYPDIGLRGPSGGNGDPPARRPPHPPVPRSTR